MYNLRQELRELGCKVTPQRILILEVLQKAHEHLSAEEIANHARKRQPNLSLGTVYRNLNILCNLGLVRCGVFKDSGRLYEINRRHHHHLVCLDCGQTTEIDYCPINEMVRKMAESHGFKIEDHDFEITGYCQKCRGC